MTETTPKRLPTNLRMLAILDALGETEAPSTPTELGRRLGLPKQTIHRLCATLDQEGYLVRDKRGGGFRPGRKAREMASSILHGSTSHIKRHQVLQGLANQIRETINFVVPEEGGMSYKDRVETNWAFRIQLPVGTNVPFHCTASGKAFLASLPRTERQRLVNVMQLEKLTEHTYSDPGSLLTDLSRIARDGYALDREEFMIGMVAAAVPVMDPAGRYCASLAFHGPVQRISIDRAVELVPLLRGAAASLTEAIFQQP